MKRQASLMIAALGAVAVIAIGGAPSAGARNRAPDAVRAGQDKSTAHVGQRPAADGRQGGETIADAVVIGGIPFEDSGATCDNIDDYDEICPYDGSDSPDVVYAYTPNSDIGVCIDLCLSQYDTKVYVYDQDLNLIDCNDDYYYDEPCGIYVSYLENVQLTGGMTYYIVVDGYGGDCGTYEFAVWDSWYGPPTHCPDEHIPEGEPPLSDGYVDTYNATCELAVPFAAEFGTDCWTLCAVGGLYHTAGEFHFDHDWFVCQPLLEEIPITLTTEAGLWVRIYTGSNCDDLTEVFSDYVNWWQPLEITVPTAGVPLVYLEIVTDDWMLNFDYLVEICGIDPGPVATETRSWSAVKAAYR